MLVLLAAAARGKRKSAGRDVQQGIAARVAGAWLDISAGNLIVGAATDKEASSR